VRIGFDLDGVLADSSIGLFRAADFLPEASNTEEVYLWVFRTAQPKLNPNRMLLTEEDEYYIITSRFKKAEKITKAWVKKHCPSCKKLIILNHRMLDKVEVGDKEVYEWLDEGAKMKAKALIENNIELYFEDSAYTVKKLREYCPETIKIVNFGDRV